FLTGLAVLFYLPVRSYLTQRRLPWILDRQQDAVLKGDTLLRSLSSISHLEVAALQSSRGEKWCHVIFAPALKVPWRKRLFQEEPVFEFESDLAAWTFATEIHEFLGFGILQEGRTE